MRPYLEPKKSVESNALWFQGFRVSGFLVSGFWVSRFHGFIQIGVGIGIGIDYLTTEHFLGFLVSGFQGFMVSSKSGSGSGSGSGSII